MDWLRRGLLPGTVYLALGTREAMILELTDPGCVPQLLSLCSQLFFLSHSRALVLSHAASDTGSALMDQLLLRDPAVAAARLRWRPPPAEGERSPRHLRRPRRWRPQDAQDGGEAARNT